MFFAQGFLIFDAVESNFVLLKAFLFNIQVSSFFFVDKRENYLKELEVSHLL